MVNDRGAAVTSKETYLRREAETLEVTLKSIGDGVIVTDVAGCVTFLNPVAERITGWSVADARGQPFGKLFQIVNEHTSEPVEHPVAKVLETGGIVGLANHTILIARDGRRVPIDDSGAPVRLPNGELIGIVVVFRDVTERKRAELERAWLAAIVASSDDAIASKTLDGIVTSWNPAATRLFGYLPAEIIGKPITTIIPPELHAEEVEILARLRRGERIEHYETVRLAKDGRRIDISLTISPVKGQDGTIMGASKIARDISLRKRNEHLLREADQQKDEFLATLAHELRNPLAPICAAAELLKKAKSLAPELRAATAILERQARHMTHLVDDLLDISRITSGRIRLQQETVELGELLKTLIDTHRHSLQSARHQARVAIPGTAVHVCGDRVRLTQILSNILHNAIKYTPPGGRIEIALREEDRQAVISVRDNGLGIPAARLEHIFEPFTQLDTSYEHGDGGLGIGLMLAKRLVELHGGSIEARSAGRGKGTEFLIRLPIVAAAPAKHTSASPRHSESAASRRVLIADDNHDAAVSLSMLLQAMGHDTRVVHDGNEALEEAELFRPEVVLLDIGMPRLDGYETARRMRRRPWAAAAQIVAVTGWGQETDRQRAKEAGFDRHLVKPVDLGALSEALSGARESPRERLFATLIAPGR
ncbi:MAG TPA: PAS domain S-box protein [Steroidobacteraceae bacterium]